MKVNKKKVLELYDGGGGLNISGIRESLGYSRNTIAKVIRDAKATGIDLAKLANYDASEIDQLLQKPTEPNDFEEPDFEYAHKEMDENPDVNIKLCWSEYHRACVERGTKPYMYSRYCDLYRKWAKKANVTKRIVHRPGYAMQSDWVGSSGKVVDKITAETTKAYFFIATMPYSGRMYVEAFPNMKQESWITAHVHAFRYFGGVPTILVIDNLKTGISKPDNYEPVINPVFEDMTRYYDVVVVPHAVAYPKGKAQVERTVNFVETWIIAYLRHRAYPSFADLNEAVLERVEVLNEAHIPAKDSTRNDLFSTAESARLKPLPKIDYEMATWTTAKLAPDCHFQFDHQRYSAPYTYIGRELDLRITNQIIEAYFDGEIICSHPKITGRIGQYKTKDEHMPPHLQDSNRTWSAEGFKKWAKKIGPDTERAVSAILDSRKVVEQAYRSCRGILAIAEKKGSALVEKACGQALEVTSLPSYTQIRNLTRTIEVTPIIIPSEDALCQSRLGDIGLIRDPNSYTLRRN